MAKSKFTEADIKEIIDRYNSGESIYDIAADFDCNPETVRRVLVKNDVPRRANGDNGEEVVLCEDDVYHETNLTYNKEINNLTTIPLFLDQIESGSIKKKDATLTFVLSDLHIGHTDFLPKSFYSSLKTMSQVLAKIKELYNITASSVVLNGDIVSGRDVYRFQELDNLVTKGHWQVFLAKSILLDFLSELHNHGMQLNAIYMVRGTHDALSENYLLYLKEMLCDYKTYYNSRMLLLNIGKPIGNYNIIFTHGRGSSEFSPVPPVVVKDILKVLQQYKMMNVPIERICTAHTHNLVTNYRLEGLTFDITGGFQRWDKSLSQRSCGFLIYLYSNGTVFPIEIRPDIRIESAEKVNPALEFENIKFYGEKLLELLKQETQDT